MSRKERIDLDERHSQAADALCQCKPGSTDPGAEFNRVITTAGVRRRREQHGIVTDTVTSARLAQNEPATQNSVLGKIFSRHPAGVHGPIPPRSAAGAPA